MIQLIKLEIQKNAIRTYVYASIIIMITMIGLIYLLAYAPQLEPNDPDLLIFAGYDNVVKLYGVVNMAVFCVFSCVLYSQFIIEAYKGKQLILLLSYPVNHTKIIIAKLLAVFLFTSCSMIICNLVVFSIFTITESFAPIITEIFTSAVIFNAFRTTIIMVIVAASLSVIATGIGFYTKSVPSTIIAGVILSSLFCNIVFSSLTNEMVLWVFMSIVFLLGIVIIMLLGNKVNKLEAI